MKTVLLPVFTVRNFFIFLIRVHHYYHNAKTNSISHNLVVQSYQSTTQNTVMLLLAIPKLGHQNIIK